MKESFVEMHTTDGQPILLKIEDVEVIAAAIPHNAGSQVYLVHQDPAESGWYVEQKYEDVRAFLDKAKGVKRLPRPKMLTAGGEMVEPKDNFYRSLAKENT